MKKEDLALISNEVKFFGTVEGGFCWDALTRKRMNDPKSLEPYGYKVYSQNDEDGIIQEIFRRIGTTDKRFIEFGVQDGLESNCHLLLFYGWRGLWIEGSEESCDEISVKFKPVIENGQLKVKNEFITKENVNSLFEEAGFTGEIDLLSIDIDGNDLYIWEAITTIRPRVVITEYNGKFPPDLEWSQAYNNGHVWNGTDWHGASLKSFEKLGRKKGYRLVGTDVRGCNAFFVREDLAGELFYEPATAEALYNPLRTRLVFVADHPAKYCLAVQKENFGLLNYQTYELVKGFYSEERYADRVFVWTSCNESLIKVIVGSKTKAVFIPYSVPQKVLEVYESFSFEIITDRGFGRKYLPVDSEGIIEIPIDSSMDTNDILDIKIITSQLWKPSEMMSSSDERSLGVCINLSGIKKTE